MPERIRNRIYLYGAGEQAWDVRVDLYWRGAVCATLLFMRAGRELPRNCSRNGVALLYFRVAHFAAVMDLLGRAHPHAPDGPDGEVKRPPDPAHDGRRAAPGSYRARSSGP